MSGAVLNASKPGVYSQVWDAMLVSTDASVPGDIRTIETGSVNSTTLAFNSCRQPLAADLVKTSVVGHGLFCVALDTVAAGATGRFRIKGQVQALIVATPAVGTRMTATDQANGLTAGAAAATNQKEIAIMQETGVAAALKMVEFNGWEGFSYFGA